MDKGLTIVYTGKGKGKTTAALGLALRATGYQKKICMIQFIKGSWHYGEMDSSKNLNHSLKWLQLEKDLSVLLMTKAQRRIMRKLQRKQLRLVVKKSNLGKYDIVILDEINYAVNLNLVSLTEVLQLIKSKPYDVDLVLTGNYAKKEIIEIADLVTEMKEIKHPFQSGIKAKKGIDF